MFNIKIILFFVSSLKFIICHEELLAIRTKPVLIKNFDKVDYTIRDCYLNVINDAVNPQPLLIYPGTEDFYYPNRNGIIEISYGRSIELSCNKKFTGKFDGLQKIIATCVGNKTFLTNGKRFQFNEYLCNDWSNHIARRTNRKCHEDLATIIEIGFELNDNRFMKIADICHNEYLQSTLYALHYLNPASQYNQKNITRINFKQGNFYNDTNVNNVYKQVTQKNTVGNILNGDHEKYFNEKKSLFLARGHLSAKGDHIYGSQQRATFYYLNVAPQWQIFNAGNWQIIEDRVRHLATNRHLYLECYTGTWGVGTLADRNGIHREIYLNYDNNNKGLIPVPKLYYRVVIEPQTKRGIVLIGVNNPHLTLEEIENDYIICDDISDYISWFNFDKKNIHLGYSYACEVYDFIKIVNHLPILDITGILY